jgi:hypothetical protein
MQGGQKYVFPGYGEENYITRPVHLRLKVGFWTVITAMTVITPYRTVQITVGQNYGVRPDKTVPSYRTILIVIWLFSSNFGPKQLFSFCNSSLLIKRNQVLRPTLSFHASHCWAYPPSWCSPNLASGSFREAVLWRQHVRGACWKWKWEVLGWRGLSEAIFALAVPAWHCTVHHTVNNCNYGKLRSSQIIIWP